MKMCNRVNTKQRTESGGKPFPPAKPFFQKM